MKKKILIILILLSSITLISSATYSLFTTDAIVSTIDQKIAKFIINSESFDNLSIPLSNMNPGDIKEVNFSIGNSKDDISSDITIGYILTIKTPHYIPFIIELYKEDKKLLTCDETYSRNSDNEIVCHTDEQVLLKENKLIDNYKLKITFDKNYNDYSYSDLIDYINIELNSYQKSVGEA